LQSERRRSAADAVTVVMVHREVSGWEGIANALVKPVNTDTVEWKANTHGDIYKLLKTKRHTYA
jgi:hypothetical protein